MGILSRGISGISNHTLIVNFPGSPKAIEEGFGVIAPTLGTWCARCAATRRTMPPTEAAAGAHGRGARRGRPGDRAARPRARLRRADRAQRRDARRCPRAARSRCSAPTAPARRRCCGSSPRCCARTAARRACSGTRCPSEGWAVRGRVGLLGARPAALPRPVRAREPALPRARCTGVGRGGADRGAAGRGRDDAAGGRAGAHALARDDAARGGLPGGAARARAAAARRAAGEPRPRRGRGRRAR